MWGVGSIEIIPWAPFNPPMALIRHLMGPIHFFIWTSREEFHSFHIRLHEAPRGYYLGSDIGPMSVLTGPCHLFLQWVPYAFYHEHSIHFTSTPWAPSIPWAFPRGPYLTLLCTLAQNKDRGGNSEGEKISDLIYIATNSAGPKIVYILSLSSFKNKHKQAFMKIISTKNSIYADTAIEIAASTALETLKLYFFWLREPVSLLPIRSDLDLKKPPWQLLSMFHSTIKMEFRVVVSHY